MLDRRAKGVLVAYVVAMLGVSVLLVYQLSSGRGDAALRRTRLADGRAARVRAMRHSSWRSATAACSVSC